VSVLSDSIYLIDPESGVIKTLVSGLVNFQSGYASWAPDHRQLAYGNAGIFVSDAGTGKTRTVVAGQLLSMPAWSPDGKQLLYGDGVSLWLTSVARPAPVQVPLPKTMAPLAMDWAPSKAIAFEGLQVDCNQPGPCLSTNISDIWRTGADGSALAKLTDVGRAENPRWSRDGSQILFVRHLLVHKLPYTQIWVVKSNGTGLRRLTDATGMLAAAWSPDGKQIGMISTGTQPNSLQVWIENADGSNLHPVGDPLLGSSATIDW